MPVSTMKWLERSRRGSRDLLLDEIRAADLLTLTPEQQREITTTEIKIALASSRGIYTGMIGAVLLAAVASVYVQDITARAMYWGWCVMLVLGLAHYPYIVRRMARGPKRFEEPLRIRPLALIGGGYCGVLWGASAWLLLPTPSPHFQGAVMVAIALVMLGSAGALAVYRPLLLAFIIPLVVVFGLGLLRLGGAVNLALSLGFGLLAYTIVEYAKVQEQGVRAAIALRFKAENLLAEIRAQQELTARALTEAQEAREAAELANQGKTTFLAAAGHDLRQPMHALVQYFAHLRRCNRDPVLDETLGRMGKSLDAMQDLLASIVEVSKLMMGAVRPSIECMSMSEVLERLDAQLRPIAEDKGLEFIVEDNGSIVATDEVLLERVLRNLTLNAIRYTDRGRVLVRCRRRSDRLRLQVWDTGIGIPKEEQEKIFEEFYQVGNEARDRRKGLGLGLALVRQLASLLGLRVRLRSTPGRGSVFMVDVPIGVDDLPTPERTPEQNEHDYVRNAFVVLIDDNDASLEATAETLKDFGCHVVAARSGLEAISLLQGQEFMPQLVISDYRLGHGESGIAAIRMVIENQQALFGDTFDIPALVISGDTAPAELLAVKHAGYSMLHKPVQPEALHTAINQALAALATAAA